MENLEERGEKKEERSEIGMGETTGVVDAELRETQKEGEEDKKGGEHEETKEG